MSHPSGTVPVNPAQNVGMDNARSREQYQRARLVLPGGVTRVTIEKDPYPTYVDRGEGPYLFDIDGNRYLDLANNFTTLIHGHAFPPVVEALQRQAARGTCFGNPTVSEIELAELIVARVPAIERIRFVNTGTEAVMHAIKAARSFTGRTKIAKIEGAYHGGYDWAEISENSTPQDWGDTDPAPVASCRHTPKTVLEQVVVLPFNDAQAARRIIDQHSDDLAAVLIDVMPSRAGLVPGTSAFLGAVQESAHRAGALLISDEVLNFRLSYAGAASKLGIAPDLFTLGKIIGGGLPIGAIAGNAEVMRVFESTPDGVATPQGGTFSANPLSMVAGLVSLSHLDQAAFEHLDALGEHVRVELARLFKARGIDMAVTGLGSFFRIHASKVPPTTYREAYKPPASARLIANFCRHLAQNGLSMAAGGLGALSTPMGETEITLILDAFNNAVRKTA